ncbi:unnamed protein product (macronuclear) [Paramecium tetraurelia]|uniref:Phosphatidic acid phosphatase type 2/haloperoxidase domain-containing protein n=1 Tax=Paramecium tetraurelia TaxID=5888 RepID=A0D7L2_PARTE|nr:uncharacterized protein GSPATT00013996001 [Paramecium tetraurelia]CAK79029.1 unnamed protein product [Paramecium tetraurelia]|eukprot:XP_001446426.1 hypothetical protein (macronuclear) [Paramecium tetraurelia strain d4-2]
MEFQISFTQTSKFNIKYTFFMNKVTFSTILATLILVSDVFFSKYTYEFSNSITKFLQNKFEYGQEQGTFEYFLLIFSTAGDAIVTNILAILIWFKATNKEQALKIFTMNALASSLGNLVKMIAAQPRPFYIDDQIKLDFCYTGYGDPSGHSLRPFVFYVILLETIVCKKYKPDQKQLIDDNQFYKDNQSQLTQTEQSISCNKRFKLLYPNSPISFKQCQFFLGVFIFLIGIGRLYFGVHFLNQIILGWILGMYLLYLYYYCGLEQFIHSLYVEAKRIKDEKTCTKIAKYINLGIMLSLLYLITLIICYFRHYSQQILDEKEEWKKLILRQDTCLHKGHYSYEKKFETSDVQYISIIFFPLYLFVLYEQPPEQPNKSPLRLWLSKGNIIKLTLYFFCYLIQEQQRYIIKLFEKGVPRLMITLIFEHIYYINYALFLLIFIPFVQTLGNNFISKFRKPTRTIQLAQFEIEL